MQEVYLEYAWLSTPPNYGVVGTALRVGLDLGPGSLNIEILPRTNAQMKAPELARLQAHLVD